MAQVKCRFSIGYNLIFDGEHERIDGLKDSGKLFVLTSPTVTMLDGLRIALLKRAREFGWENAVDVTFDVENVGG